jgi:hypothetical protein
MLRFFFIILVFSFSVFAKQEQVEPIEGIAVYSFSNEDYIFYHGNKFFVVDKKFIFEKDKFLLEKSIVSGQKFSIGISSGAMKYSWEHDNQQEQSLFLLEEEKMTELGSDIILLIGKKLLSAIENKTFVQVKDNFFVVMNDTLAQENSQYLDSLKIGDHLRIVLNKESIASVYSVNMKGEVVTQSKNEHVFLIGENLFLSGKVIWTASVDMGGLESKGVLFVFKKAHLNDQISSFFDSPGSHISVLVPIRDLITVVYKDQRVHLDLIKDYSTKWNEPNKNIFPKF